jgi:transposase
MTVKIAVAHAHVQRLVSVVKMTTLHEDYTAKEQRSVARFLWAKGLTKKDIHKQMFLVYSGKCLSPKVVHNWVEKFSQGCSKVTDVARPGRPVETAIEATVQQVEELIQAVRKITIDSPPTALRCSHGLAYNTMHDSLKFQKVCTWWVPRELKDPEK